MKDLFQFLAYCVAFIAQFAVLDTVFNLPKLVAWILAVVSGSLVMFVIQRKYFKN